MKIEAAFIQPKIQIILIAAMLCLAYFFSKSYPLWWKCAFVGALLGMGTGALWWVAFFSALPEIASAKTTKTFMYLLHATSVGKVHKIFSWLAVGIVALFVYFISEEFTLPGFIVGCSISAATTSMFQVAAIYRCGNVA